MAVVLDVIGWKWTPSVAWCWFEAARSRDWGANNNTATNYKLYMIPTGIRGVVFCVNLSLNTCILTISLLRFYGTAFFRIFMLSINCFHTIIMIWWSQLLFWLSQNSWNLKHNVFGTKVLGFKTAGEMCWGHTLSMNNTFHL